MSEVLVFRQFCYAKVILVVEVSVLLRTFYGFGEDFCYVLLFFLIPGAPIPQQGQNPLESGPVV